MKALTTLNDTIWSEKSVKCFWERNKAPFAGDVKASEILRLSRPFCKDRILDVGAGSGALVDALFLKREIVVGIDTTPRHHHLVIQASVAALPFGDKSFDTVYATDVLEHLTDDVLMEGLTEIQRVMSTGAYFITVVPYNEILEQNLVSCPRCDILFHRWGHVQSFSQDKIVKLLVELGFRVVKIVALPLGMMAEHWLIQHFWRLFVQLDFLKLSDYFVIAEKK